MSLPPALIDIAKKAHSNIFRRTRFTIFWVLCALLACCLAFVWMTGDAGGGLRFLPGRGPARSMAKKTLVDVSPWETAQTLAALAVTAEENQYAREAEHLADHDVDQAFAAALRQGTLQAQHLTLTGDALALSKKVDQLQELLKQDLAQVRQLTPPDEGKSTGGSSDDTDFEIAKAQLQLDSEQLEDAQDDLARATGDQRAQIQSELQAHEAAMKKYDAESHLDGQVAVVAVGQSGTLIRRLGGWNRQRERRALLEQAIQTTQRDVQNLAEQHNTLEQQAGAALPDAPNLNDRAAKLAAIKDRSAERQLLTIFDDRIQTKQQLITVYTKWSAQVLKQHRTVGHRILQSFAWILVILICMMLGNALVRRLMEHPALERRQAQTLRMLVQLGVQVVGVLLILLMLFGVPHETPTILGLTTAALTIALQDFVLAFFGWFVLMGKRGIRSGDWVEINSVSGEVSEVGLMRTTLLETSSLAERGTPTGRRISFMNSFAIRGQYFNFSTNGQWMWDEIKAAVPASVDINATMDRILLAVQEETQQNARLAEQEWKRGAHGQSLATFRTDPLVNLRPSGSGVDLEVRFVTRASERFEVRNRLYRRVFNLLHERVTESEPLPAS